MVNTNYVVDSGFNLDFMHAHGLDLWDANQTANKTHRSTKTTEKLDSEMFSLVHTNLY
jgi:hypothetical protein